MRLTVPEPKINLYNDGFADHDQLDRKATGDKLSDLVERIDDPMVIALDGAWGSGKSFFLKCWVGEHLKRKENTTQTVYFDAFEHDFLDDPLIALTGAIAERFERDKKLPSAERESRVQKLKKFGWVLGKSSAKIGVSVAGHYAKKLVGEECLEEFGKDLEEASQKGVATAEDEVKTLIDSGIGNEASEVFWREQRAKIVAMSAFREVLTELTEPATKEQAEDDPELQEGTPTRKLVVVIDELDRCRPDYALSLLEIIKHFFNVPGVHFVLGVNLKELQNSVRARYGSGIDAAMYLQKFISIVQRFPLRSWENSAAQKSFYLKTQLDLLELSQAFFSKDVIAYIERIEDHYEISLRGLNKLCTLVATTPDWTVENSIDGKIDRSLVSGLLVLNALRPKVFNTIKDETEDPQEIFSALCLETGAEAFTSNEPHSIAWLLCFFQKDHHRHLQQYYSKDFNMIASSYHRATPRSLINAYVEAFDISET
ncbi:KAP family P-loop NTPase fold protein [Phaeobacter italicus]|uniref:KAP family P-loop NTPase fold protein n=1 Tax=Phaeobacter italicus TaxID=481446 RepID=UPI0001870399|nr:P-loop NTPase fold protein [Phaeobacter italicus]EEB72827.1 hypothetical protein RR11_3590 [Ruegeria sp. R11]CRL13012.1 putative P-loop ATPase [Phaeobacter italicus]SFH36616.1 KAP family P-loop domain-containing protein [Phaeobacter italicus]